MWIYTKIEPTVKTNFKKNKYKRTNVFICDCCLKEFERSFNTSSTLFNLNFCSRSCSAKICTTKRWENEDNVKKLSIKLKETYSKPDVIAAKIISAKKGAQTRVFKIQEMINSNDVNGLLELERKKIAKIAACQATRSKPEVAEKISKIMKKVANDPKVRAKIRSTLKANNTFGKSKIEDKFYEYLCNIFNKNIERQVCLNGWSIDIYISNLDIYIQFDGEYWHGLNRPLDIIKIGKNQHDIGIYKTFLKDREQEKWFLENKKILIRITDHEFKGHLKNDTFYEFIINIINKKAA